MDDDNSVIIPFILTKQHGGEYDDEAFAAGWHLAILDARLAFAVHADLFVPPVLLKTKWNGIVDLIAMSHNLFVKVIPTPDPELSYFTIATQEFFDA